MAAAVTANLEWMFGCC